MRILDHRGVEALAALQHRDDDFFGLLAVGLYNRKPSTPPSPPFLPPLKGCASIIASAHFWNSYLSWTGERASAVEVFWHANNLKSDTGKGVFQAPLDEMNGEMGDVDADPAAV